MDGYTRGLTSRPDKLRAEIATKQAELRAIFAEAGPELDLTLVKSIEGDTTAKVAEIRRRNDELAMLAEAERVSSARRGGITFPGGGRMKSDPDDVRVLTKDQRVAELVASNAPGHDLSMGRYLQGIVTGDWGDVDPQVKAMSVGQDAAAGYLVPAPLSAAIIDRARNASVAFQAGALTVPMDSSTLTVARLATDPVPAWKEENASIASSDATFEAVILTAKTLSCIVKGSVELFEDAQNIEGTIEDSLGKALALELDRVALRGSGAAGEPAGVLSQAGVTITSAVGSPADYVKFADDPTRTLRDANAAEPFTFIAAPRTFQSLDKLVTGISGDKTRLAAPPAWSAYRRLSTAAIPINLGGGTNESQAFVGDFSQLIVGMRTQLTIEATRVGGDAGGGAFSSLQVWIRAYLRADIALRHPAHFVVLDGVLA